VSPDVSPEASPASQIPVTLSGRPSEADEPRLPTGAGLGFPGPGAPGLTLPETAELGGWAFRDRLSLTTHLHL
jgi:hypothetical protein